MPHSNRQAFHERPLQAWLDEGRRLIGERGIAESSLNASVRSRLLKSIAQAYWRSLLEYADEQKLVPKRKGEEIDQAVGRCLGVSDGTVSRWMSDQICPDADKVFGTIVIVLKKELGQVTLPSNRDIALRASCRTISRIRAELCNLGQLELKNPVEFHYVHALVRHPWSDLFLDCDRPTTVREIYLDLIKRVVGRPVSGGEAAKLLEFAERAVDRWLIPYVLFRFALTRPWEHLDDDAFRVDTRASSPGR